jgi:hypothetical protein
MNEPVVDARNEAKEARARLTGTLGQVKHGLLPSTLIGVAKNAAKARALQVAVGSLLTARKRPKTAALVAIASMLYAFRKPLTAALRQRPAKEKNDDQID